MRRDANCNGLRRRAATIMLRAPLARPPETAFHGPIIATRRTETRLSRGARCDSAPCEQTSRNLTGGFATSTTLPAYSLRLGRRIAEVSAGHPFIVLLGGDCTILLGSLVGLRERPRAVGLVYIDAHADFATLNRSRSGSACSMNLALAGGRSRAGPIARLGANHLCRRAMWSIWGGGTSRTPRTEARP
jgi:arginase